MISNRTSDHLTEITSLSISKEKLAQFLDTPHHHSAMEFSNIPLTRLKELANQAIHTLKATGPQLTAINEMESPNHLALLELFPQPGTYHRAANNLCHFSLTLSEPTTLSGSAIHDSLPIITSAIANYTSTNEQTKQRSTTLLTPGTNKPFRHTLGTFTGSHDPNLATFEYSLIDLHLKQRCQSHFSDLTENFNITFRRRTSNRISFNTFIVFYTADETPDHQTKRNMMESYLSLLTNNSRGGQARHNILGLNFYFNSHDRGTFRNADALREPLCYPDYILWQGINHTETTTTLLKQLTTNTKQTNLKISLIGWAFDTHHIPDQPTTETPTPRRSLIIIPGDEHTFHTLSHNSSLRALKQKIPDLNRGSLILPSTIIHRTTRQINRSPPTSDSSWTEVVKRTRRTPPDQSFDPNTTLSAQIKPPHQQLQNIQSRLQDLEGKDGQRETHTRPSGYHSTAER